MTGVIIVLPVILMPNHRQNPYRGTMVHGLFTNAAVKTTSLLKRNIHAKKRQLIVCNPMVGENAMKIPTAKDVASLFGESFNRKRLLMRSLIFFIKSMLRKAVPLNVLSDRLPF
jgi:predicted lipase